MDVYAAVMFVDTAWCKGMWAAVRLLGGLCATNYEFVLIFDSEMFLKKSVTQRLEPCI